MQSKSVFHAFVIPAICFGIFVGLPSGLFAEYIDISVDEIIFEDNSANDPLLQDLNPRVQMSFNSSAKLLTILLSNDACYAGLPDAGHLLTGMGFNLPSGVSIEDTEERDSAISLPAGSVIIDPVSDPNGTGGIPLSQDNWGYANNVDGGHFVDPAVLTTDTVLSCFQADAEWTFARNKASVATMNAFDYGLQGLDPTPGHSVKRSIRNALAFDLYLAGPAETDWDGLLSHIEDNPVVVSYGSPGKSSVPEPGVLPVCFALLFGLLGKKVTATKSGQYK